jgi:outer membrane receptor protein involved in Fe transport
VHFRTFVVSISVSLVFIAPADAAVVQGRVVDPESRAVPGAQVVIVCGPSVAATATTDAEGRFRTSEAAGQCELRVAIDGFAARPVPLDLIAGAGLQDAGTIRLDVSAVSESVIVSAAQVDVPLSQASSAVTVITASELRARQLMTVADALREVPGLSVARSGTTGALTSVFPRGGESDYTLVFIDGVQANAFGGGFDFAHLSTDNIDRIEIVRGPQSALFGRNALGGIINITSARPSLQKWSGSLVAPYGNFKAGDVRGSAAGPLVTNKLSAAVGFGYSRRDGFTMNDLTGRDLDSRSAVFGKGQILWKPNARWEARAVVSAERARDGDYALGDLAPGKWRVVAGEDLQALLRG